MSNRPPYGPKTTAALKGVLNWWQRSGEASQGWNPTPVIAEGVRWAKAHPEGDDAWEPMPASRRYPFELGRLNNVQGFVGSDSWIEAYAGPLPVLENSILLLKYMPGDSIAETPGIWTLLTWASGHLSGVTVDTIAAGGTGTVAVDGLGQVELTNWSSRSLASGKACKVSWNYVEMGWEILVANC